MHTVEPTICKSQTLQELTAGIGISVKLTSLVKGGKGIGGVLLLRCGTISQGGGGGQSGGVGVPARVARFVREQPLGLEVYVLGQGSCTHLPAGPLPLVHQHLPQLPQGRPARRVPSVCPEPVSTQ